MSDTSGTVRKVAWLEVLPWLSLVRTVRIALMARVFVLGAVGLIAMTLGWRAIGWLFSTSDDTVIAEWRLVTSEWLWDQFAIPATVRSAADLFREASSGLPDAPITVWLYLTRPFIDLFRNDLTPTGFLFLLVCGLWELLVWGIVGGAITRIAALKLTRDEAPGLVAAVKHAAGKLPSYCLAPLIALAGASVFSLQLVVLGLVMRIGVFAMVAGLLWPFALMLGLLMAILLIGALAGWPLMWATVSVEGTDAFDALSRSYAYVFQRPWRLLWYVFFAFVLAAISMFVVKLFAIAAISLSDWSVDWGLDEAGMRSIVAPRPALEGPLLEPGVPALEPPPRAEPLPGDRIPADSVTERIAALAIHFWKSALAALAAGYQVGFLWVAAVGIYLLLRRDIDGAEMDEVYLEQEDEYGLPPLTDDAGTGVPEVAPGEPAQPGDMAPGPAPDN